MKSALALACLAGLVRAEETDWDDIMNNLFTDIAPILALFGERVTMQFMSQAIGWEDCVMLAMAPLGVLTIIVSAIRVGGPMWLKGIVGRARENIATAEIELMSSTSKDVCELNNGSGIVRCQGSAPVWEYIIIVPEKASENENQKNPDGLEFEFMTLAEALERGRLVKKESHDYLSCFRGRSRWYPSRRIVDDDAYVEQSTKRASYSNDGPSCIPVWVEPGFAHEYKAAHEYKSEHEYKSARQKLQVWHDELRAASKEANEKTESAKPSITIVYDSRPESPSVSLNLQDSSDRQEARLLALFGIVLQLAVLTFFAAMTFHPHFSLLFLKDGSPAAAHAFPFATSGTIMLVSGLLICSHVVEASTEEEHYMLPDASPRIQTYWLQQQQTVADQSFDSIATWPSVTRSTITMSRRRRTKDGTIGLETRTLVGVVTSLLGFTAQFIGLRSMHSAASIAQLVAIGIMTMLRVWLRRSSVRGLCQNRLTPGHEIDWLTFKLEQLSRDWSCKPDEPRPSTSLVDRNGNPVSSAWSVDPSYSRANSTVNLGTTDDKGRNRETEWTKFYRMEYSLADISRKSPTVYIPVPRSPALTALSVRRGLASLARVRGQTTDDAVRLADAILKAIDTIIDANPISEREDIRPFCYFPWLLRVWYTTSMNGSCGVYVVPIILESPKLPGMQHSALVEQLDGVLSLWQYSVGISSCSADIQKHDDLSTEHQERYHRHQYDNWLRGSLGSQSLLILAQGHRHTMWPLISDLMCWAPEKLNELVVVHETEDELLRQDQEVTRVRLANLPGWQGWNLPHLASNQNALNWDASTEHHIFRYVRALKVFSAFFLGQNGVGKAYYGATEQSETLAIICHDRLGILHSRSLLQHLLHSICSRLRRLAGQVKLETMSNPFALKEPLPHLSHYHVSELSKVMTENGYGNPQQASLAVVSILGASSILPHPKPLFDWVWEQFSKDLVTYWGYHEDFFYEVARRFSKICSMMAIHVYGNVEVLYRAIPLLYDACMIVETSNLRTGGRAYCVPTLIAERPDDVSRFKKILTSLDYIYGSHQKRSYYKFLDDRVRGSTEKLGQRARSRTPRRRYQYNNKAWIERKETWRSGGIAHDPKICQYRTSCIEPGPSWNSHVGKTFATIADDISGWTIYHYHAVDCHPDKVISYNNERAKKGDRRKWTPLHYAAQVGNLTATRALLAAGASANARAIDGTTPLHVAAQHGWAAIVRALDDQRPVKGKMRARHMKDIGEWRPWRWAALNKHVTSVRMLRRAGKPLSVRQRAAANHDMLLPCPHMDR